MNVNYVMILMQYCCIYVHIWLIYNKNMSDLSLEYFQFQSIDQQSLEHKPDCWSLILWNLVCTDKYEGS